MPRFTFALSLVLPLAAMAAPAYADKAGDKIANSYICVFKKNAVSKADAPLAASKAVRDNGGQLKHVYKEAVRGFATEMGKAGIDKVRAENPNIAYCEEDRIITVIPIDASGTQLAPVDANGRVGVNDGGGKGGGGGGTPTPVVQQTPWGITRVGGGTNGTFATAWVIDSGIDLAHPDLSVDTARSRSFIAGLTAQDQNGHGTHVAGTIAALNNSIGVVGVAPGARVVAVRVLDRRGSGATSGVIAGVDYVAQNGQPGDVANMSLGGSVSQALDDAVVAAAARGVRFVLAAGNSAANANNHSPARSNGANIYTVSAFGTGDVFASFSNFGNPPVDFAEPGVGVRSTWLAKGYNTISGTSMAAPHLAGLLLAGPVRSGGNVLNDRDGNPDIIGVR